MTELKSFKNISRLVAVIMALLTMLSMITVEQWQTILPTKYVIYAPIIATGIAFIVNQYSEEKRVSRAEDLIHQKYYSPTKGEDTSYEKAEEIMVEDIPAKDLTSKEDNMEDMEDGC